MATIAINEMGWERPALSVTIRLPGIVWVLVRRWRERRLHVRLARLSDHLIRDAGFDPDVVRAAVAGPWDALPGRLRHR